MRIITYTILLLALLLFTACGNGDSSAESAQNQSQTAADNYGFIEFEGVTHEIEWSNCRHSESRWQADASNPFVGLDISRRANVPNAEAEGYNYFMYVNLNEDESTPPERRYYNYWLTTDLDIEVSDAGISGTANIHPRSISQGDAESLKKPIRFNIRC